MEAKENNGHTVMCPLGRVPNIITLSYCFRMFNLILFRCRQRAVDNDNDNVKDEVRMAGRQSRQLLFYYITDADYNNTLHMVP